MKHFCDRHTIPQYNKSIGAAAIPDELTPYSVHPHSYRIYIDSAELSIEEKKIANSFRFVKLNTQFGFLNSRTLFVFMVHIFAISYQMWIITLVAGCCCCSRCCCRCHAMGLPIQFAWLTLCTPKTVTQRKCNKTPRYRSPRLTHDVPI